MPSIFPGMDPYIEACGLWEDFHAKLISEIERFLATAVPEQYVVRLGERTYIVMESSGRRSKRAMLPDIAIASRRNNRERKKQTTGVAVAELPAGIPAPTLMRAPIETEFRETFVEIHEVKPRRLVTSIEVLSPSNKRQDSRGWERYLRKRQALLAGEANLVEIDLLRGGQRMPMVDDWPDSPYYVLVSRKEKPYRCEVWPGHFRTPLPSIPVPLRPPDSDVPLSLQALIASVYARSRYEKDIDYRRPLRPPLGAEDATWLKKHLKKGSA